MTGSLADYYHWEETDRGIRIYMHAGMVDRLQAEVLRSENEVGGILLGRTETDRGYAIAVIDDFVPVPCSYRGGPLYDLSDRDTVNLEGALLRTALAGCDSPEAPSALGYYRSHRRDGMSLSAADLLAIDSYFQAPASVFLLLKAVANDKACTAGFFFWEDGRIQSEFSPLEVALAPNMDGGRPLAGAGLEPRSEASDLNDGLPADLADLFHPAALPDPPVPSSVPSTQPPVAAAPPAHPGKASRTWTGLLLRVATILIATAALVVSVVTYLGAPRPRREQAAASIPAASTLGLLVERNPPDLLVTWNRNAREVAAARSATLSIRDGEIQKPPINLDKADLVRGSYLYTPASDDIQFRLEVYGADDGSVAQSVRVSPGSLR
jgi:hypothetical protein